MKKKLHYSVYPLMAAFVVMAALLFNTCLNPNVPDESDDTDIPPVVSFISEDLVFGTDTIATGSIVGTIEPPEQGGPWSAALVDGEGAVDNALFTIDNDDRLVIAQGPLDWGPYSVRIRITSDSGTRNAAYAIDKIVQFNVVLSPAEFKEAPSAWPEIVSKGKNKLKVNWRNAAGAKGYRVYINDTNDSASAVLIDEEFNNQTYEAEISRFPGSEDEFFPDSTPYYFWVRAYNSSGSTKFSPVAEVRTTDTLQDFWLAQKLQADNTAYYNSFCGDLYSFIENDGKTVLNYWYGETASQKSAAYTGEIMYHRVYTPDEAAQLYKRKDSQKYEGKYKDDLTGTPAGFFIIKLDGTGWGNYIQPNRYYGVYYFGLDCPASSRTTYNPDGKYKTVYLINPVTFNKGQVSGYPERETLEDEFKILTGEQFMAYSGDVAVPYYQLDYKP